MFSAHTTDGSNVDLTLVHSLRRWPDIKLPLFIAYLGAGSPDARHVSWTSSSFLYATSADACRVIVGGDVTVNTTTTPDIIHAN